MAVIKETLVLDDKLSGAMANAAAACLRMANEMTGLRGDVSKVEASASSAAFGIDTMSKQMSDVVTTCNRMADAMTALQTSTAGVEQASLATARGIDKRNDRLEEADNRSDQTQASSVNLLGTLKRVAGAFVSIETAKWLVSTSDQITQLNARLELMTGSAEAAAAAQDEIYAAAQRSRGAYSEMANLVSQLGMMAPEAFSDPAGNLNVNELVAFAEQLQKQMTISGASGESAAAAMVQLTQGLSSGTLRGEELNSVLEQTPMIAKTIADYMGVSTGQMREMASEGAITADVVKNAMLSAAEETNAAFEQMPMTWAQVWTQAQNVALQAMQPVLDLISLAANNIDTLTPLVAGLTAAIAAYTIAQTAANAAAWLGVAANQALVVSMLTNPFLWVAIGIGAAVAAIAVWVQSVGGVQVAWLTAVDVVLSGVDNLRIGIYTGMYAIQNKFGEFGLAAFTMGVNVVNFFGDMKVGALEQIQGMANGAIDIINWMISKVNLLPGVAIDSIDKLTFASTAAAANEAAKASRADALAKAQAAVAKQEADRAANLNKMRSDAYSAHMQRQVGIYNAKLDAAGTSGTSAGGLYGTPSFDEMAGTLGDIGKDVNGIKKSVDLSNEDLKSLVDVATRRYVNNINLTSQTPVITINGQNTGRTKEDREALADAIALVLAEQIAAGAASTIAPRMAFG